MDGGVHDFVLGRGGGIEFGDDAAQPGDEDAVGDGENFREI